MPGRPVESDETMPFLLLDCNGAPAGTERDGHRAVFNQAFREMSLSLE